MYTQHHYDLIVVGGGFSGCAAAISASRQGLDVLLVEKSGYLGGAACNNYVNPFMSYYINHEGERKHISAGIFDEIVNELRNHHGLHQNTQTFNEEVLKLVLDKMMEESGVKVLLHSCLSGAKTSGGRIVEISTTGKSGTLVFTADTYIDATGDGNLSYLAGCSYVLGREQDGMCQPMTLCFRISGVDIPAYMESRKEINELYKKFQMDGKISNPREDVLIFPHTAPGVLHFNSTRIVKLNPVDVFDLSKAEVEARRQVFELYDFLKNNFKAFENSELLASAPEIGVRESRKILCEYTLVADDLIAGTKFDDGIAACNYDMDIHNPEGTGTSHYFFPAGHYYTIPYRCLLAKELDNLLVAGRCISASHEAQASYRIMPVCCTLGEAAGTGAAVAANAKVSIKDVDVKMIRKILLDNGAFL